MKRNGRQEKGVQSMESKGYGSVYSCLILGYIDLNWTIHVLVGIFKGKYIVETMGK